MKAIIRFSRSLFGRPRRMLSHTEGKGPDRYQVKGQAICTCWMPLGLRYDWGCVTRFTCWDCGGMVLPCNREGYQLTLRRVG